MNNQLRKSCTAIWLVLFVLAAKAQTGSFSTSTSIGLTSSILDNGIGFHLGVNPSYALSSHFSIETQVSFLYTKISSTFLSGNEGKSNAINTLIGGRVYLNSEDRIDRFYLNLLLGGNYNVEEINNMNNNGEFSLGFSGGGFLEHNRFLLGLSYDTPQNIVLKLGYNF